MAALLPDSPLPIPVAPDYAHEERLHAQDFRLVCGVDEAGRGPLAGSVVAAAVILDIDSIPDGLQDSKKLSEIKREILFDQILSSAVVSFASVSATTIDAINIRQASLLAMERAVAGLELRADFALIDGNALPANLVCPGEALIKGDGRSLSIAAASIVAKVIRDRMMMRADRLYPDYGLAGHKGYPTKAHREAVFANGPCRLHRTTFGPVAAALRARQK